MPTDQSFGVVLIRMENRKPLVLVVRENDTSSVKEEAGHWGLPKGHANPGETPEQTALRELAEETGITNCSLTRDHSWSVTYTTKKQDVVFEKTVLYFLGSTDQRNIFADPKEIAACEWLPIDQAIARVTFDNVREVLQKVAALVIPKDSE